MPPSSTPAAAPALAEYVTDVPYSRTFVPELAPTMMRLAAALEGVASPSCETFDYCELGVGTGDTIATLAAAHPRARFVGVDLNPEHVAFARSLAARGELANLDVIERDFEACGDLPDCDFISMHGVVSWLSADKRRALFELVGKKLKPGGLLFASYNALPGWAAIEPLRRFLIEAGAHVEGSTLDRAREGVRRARLLSDAGAPFFESHPTARSMLALIDKAGLPYAVHEYFHAHWHPLYFRDVARELGANDVHFVGQLPLYLGVRELAVPRAVASALGPIDDRAAYEHAKDFALNELFRGDVWVKGQRPRSEAAAVACFEATPFGTIAPRELIQRELRLKHATMQLGGPIYDAILDQIASGAASAIELSRRPSLAGVGVQRIGRCLQTLALGGQVLPMRSSAGPAPLSPGERLRVAGAFNRAVLDPEARTTNQAPLVVASPAIGTGLPLSMLDAVSFHLLTEVEQADRAAWIRAYVARRSLRLAIGDRHVTEQSEIVRVIEEAFETFSRRWPAKLLELGVLERVAR